MPLNRPCQFFLTSVVLLTALVQVESGSAQSLVLPHEPTFLTLLDDGPLPAYAKPVSGEWKVKGESFVATTKSDEKRHPALRIETEMSPLMVVAFKFRFGDGQRSSFSIRAPGTMRTVGLTPHCCWVKVADQQEKPTRVCCLVNANLGPDAWHTANIEILKEKFAITINEKVILRGKDPAFEKDKTHLIFLAGGNGGGFKGIKIWRGKSVPQTDELPDTPSIPLPTFRFLKCDRNHDQVVSFQEYREARRPLKIDAEIKANFKSMDKNGDEALCQEEFFKKNRVAPAAVSGEN